MVIEGRGWDGMGDGGERYWLLVHRLCSVRRDGFLRYCILGKATLLGLYNYIPKSIKPLFLLCQFHSFSITAIP